MNAADTVTRGRVAELVLANRAIRAPYYEKVADEGVQFTDPDRGLQWGADVVPALLGLFRVEPDPTADETERFVGVARHWRGPTMVLRFHRYAPVDETDPVVVVTSMAGRAGAETVEDEALGAIELPDEVPTEDEWAEREKRYQSARRADESDGAASVAAFLAALPGWKREVARRFDEIIQSEVPDVRRAVKWHQPFYGVGDRGWFASFSAFTNHVKLTFVCGSVLEPEPPGGTGPERQALDLTETDALDDTQVASWIRQAAADPGMGW